MAGNALQSVPDRAPGRCASTYIVALALVFFAGQAGEAQSLYKYRGQNGEWIYSDRPPDKGQTVEIRELNKGSPDAAVTVTHGYVGSSLELLARNDYYAPVELELEIAVIRGLTYPHPDQELKWLLPPRSSTVILEIDLLETGALPYLEYGFRYMPGNPDAVHEPADPYRAPIAISNNHPITQAFPHVVTHTTLDSYYAVDLSMPIGTDIFAARGGIVFDVAGENFQGGADPVKDAPKANVVRILHDDGTYAVYAHLNWNTIRVEPGDEVERGEYIADSGNTGFSTGPHLHFAVMRNVGLLMKSIPVVFMGANSESVVPAIGELLTAY